MVGVVKVEAEEYQAIRVKQCSYCHKMNQTTDESYSKHGYPLCYKQISLLEVKTKLVI